jgi:hypothetical protein
LFPALGRRKTKANQHGEAAKKALESLPPEASAEDKAGLETRRAQAMETQAKIEVAQTVSNGSKLIQRTD